MRKLLLFFVSTMFVIGTMFGSPVSKTEAVELANKFIKNSQLDMQRVSVSTLVYTESASNGEPLYYVFNLPNDGFIIVSAEDFTLPILGYSDENEFDKNNIPINMADILSDYKSEIKYAKERGFTADSEILKAREEQLNNVPKYRASVAPLLGAIKWDQSPYYNALCPVYNSYGSRCPVGCVATAMAQIMKYWEYPSRGQGSHSYNSSYGTLSANFNVDYNWASMPAATLTAPNSECAKISYHCAVSVDMNFGPNGSGAYQTDVPAALINYFKYKNTAKNANRSYYSDTQWANIVKAELDANRPVQYAGHGTGGGHSFVCDGYNSNGYFHFNWGWGGNSDGYFLLNALNPGSLGTGGGSGGFNSYQTIVIGIEPGENVNPPAPNLTTPTGLYASNITANSAKLSWNSVQNATSYTIALRKTGDNWSYYDVNTAYANVTDLSANTKYEWSVKAVNGTTSSNYSNTVSFTTLNDNGGVTPPSGYCSSTSSSSYYEWISRFAMANIDNYSSGSQYANFTNKIINVSRGQSVPVYFKADYRGNAYTEYWTIWIDYNQDGIFSDSEMVTRGYYTAGYLLRANITIPNNAVLGQTRLRISMKYGSYSSACESFYYGEVEDYTINIGQQGYMQYNMSDTATESSFTLKEGILPNVSIYPNPASERIAVNVAEMRDKESANYSIIDMSGRTVMKGILNQSDEINISGLRKGTYLLSIETEPITVLKFVKE